MAQSGLPLAVQPWNAGRGGTVGILLDDLVDVCKARSSSFGSVMAVAVLCWTRGSGP